MPKLKLKPGTILPTAQEDAAIEAAIAADPDTMSLDVDNLKFESYATWKKRGRPVKVAPKIPMNIRYSPEVIAEFKASGAGWQTRMDAALKDWLRKHNPSDVKI